MSLPRGIRNNNPGNIKELKGDRTIWVGERATDDDPIFEEFETMEHGLRALMIILLNYIKKHKLRTVKDIISRYAPGNENNTNAYINSVLKRTGWDEDYEVKPIKEDIFKLTKAICYHENGGNYITNEQLEKAWKMVKQ